MEKNQKRNIILTIIIIFFIAVIASVLIFLTMSVYNSKKQQTNENLSVNYITSSVIEKMGYQNLSEISSENICKYYEIPDGVVLESDMYVSNRPDSFTEIACFKLTDKSKQDELMKSISEYITSKNSTYKGVNEKEYQNINNSKTEVNYPYAFVVISSDSDAAVDAFNSVIKSS